ncbi:hypothetical protein E3226_005280 [Legionella geestiana]|uniref:hypothetical protein n=1 Tax=Legionella geestiana TaxID=45065 RepID=UPI0010925E7F|nr:hypothetical protein [Legionella geestiana]QDQ39846.1 hypothetical protein E3226_005280 [Legionella geestiana]
MPNGSTKAGSRQHIEKIIQFINDVQAALGGDEVRRFLEAQPVSGSGTHHWSLPVLLTQINRQDLSVRFRALKALDRHYLDKANKRNSLFDIEFIKILRNWLALCKGSHASREHLLQGMQSLQTDAAKLPTIHSSDEECLEDAASTSATSSESSLGSSTDSLEEEISSESQELEEGYEVISFNDNAYDSSCSPDVSPSSAELVPVPLTLQREEKVAAEFQEGEEGFAVFSVNYHTDDSPSSPDVSPSSDGFEPILLTSRREEEGTAGHQGGEEGSLNRHQYDHGFFSPSRYPAECKPTMRLGSYTGSRKCLDVLSENDPGHAVALLARIQSHIRTTTWDTGWFGGESVRFADTPRASRSVPRHVACQLDVMQAFVRDARNQDTLTREHLAKQALIQVLFDVPREAREKTGFCDMRRLNRFLFRSDETRAYYRTCAKGSVPELLRFFRLEQGTPVARLLHALVSEHGDAPVSKLGIGCDS